MIIVQLKGGLGNQLFQYAAGRSLSNKMNDVLKLDCSSYDIDRLRSYRLGHFRIKASVASNSDIRDVRSIKLFGIRIPPRQSFALEHIKPSYRRRTVQESQFHYNHQFTLISSPVYLTGYWQSEKYFLIIREILLSEFSLKSDITEEDRIILHATKTSNSVSVHVRRGDLIGDSHANAIHGVCSREYYLRGIKHLIDNTKDPHFFIFSDDLHWVRTNLDIGQSMTFVEHNGPERDYADLFLMRSCTHHIIANSSFSWWGAWLSDTYGKVVIAPSKWFGLSDRNTEDLLPSSWQVF